MRANRQTYTVKIKSAFEISAIIDSSFFCDCYTFSASKFLVEFAFKSYAMCAFSIKRNFDVATKYSCSSFLRSRKKKVQKWLLMPRFSTNVTWTSLRGLCDLVGQPIMSNRNKIVFGKNKQESNKLIQRKYKLLL